MRLLCLTLISNLLLFGCSATKPLAVQSNADQSYPFSAAKSWDFSGGTLETDAARNTAAHLQLNPLIETAIRNTLAARGLQEGGASPELHVSYAFGERAIDTHHKPNGGYGADGMMFPGAHGTVPVNDADGRVPPPSKDPYTSKYEEATLVIRIVDAKTRRLVFEGSVTDKTDFGYFRTEQHERIEKAVNDILEQLPRTPPAGR